MAYNLPAIIHRIESNLIALDACKLLGLTIQPDLALEALTKDSDNTGDHDQEQINFQGGMGNNYERLEFLGDCFLKLATTIALYTLYPDCNEFEYHVERMLMIANKNLMNTAVDMRLQEYVRSKAFNRRDWYPKGLKLSRGKATVGEQKHCLALKSIADVCEALIGAAYLTYDEDRNFDMAVKAVSVVVKSKKHQMTSFADYHAAYVMPPWQSEPGTAAHRELARQIAEITGYHFKSPPLARSAFKHKSYPRSFEDLPDYDRLEFLGDALLDMVIVDHLFKRFPGADPQWLTEHKMAMASNQFFGLLCVKLGFHRHIQLFHQQVQANIQDYVRKLEEAEIAAEMDTKESGRPLAVNYWVDVDSPPKCLPDVLEAYVGAVFVDSGYDFDTVRSFFEAHVRPWFEDMRAYDDFAKKHPATRLAKRMGQQLGCTEWRLVVDGVAAGEEEGAACLTETRYAAGFLVHGRVAEHAVAGSSRNAKVTAATRALRRMEGFGREEFRREFGCDCQVEEEKGDGHDLAEHGTAV